MQNTSNPIEASSTPSQPTSTQISSDKSDTTWVTPVVAENMECNIIFPQHELREPYQRNKGQPRYTLSNDELNNLLKIMAIDSLCIHSELGDPFINTDWNSQDISAATGHMLSLGFENLYHGAGWSDGYMLYSTYDFSMGTAYDSFATREDFQAVMEKSISNQIDVNGVPGFIRYQKGLSLGLIPIYKAYIFPFEDFYTAVVYGFGPFEWEQVDIALARLQTGEVPNEHSQDSNLMDVLALSIQFLHSP